VRSIQFSDLHIDFKY